MRTQVLLLATLFTAAPLAAQDAAVAGGTMPNPKSKEHEALAMLAGTWDSVYDMAAMPGIPGMEKATKTKGTEQASLICNGLWLKCQINSTFNDQPFSGIWLLGYDPGKKKYSSLWVSSMEEPPSTMDGTYDAKTKTWTFAGKCEHGDVRSVVVFADNDHMTETCFLKGEDGKETQTMQIARTRSKSAPAAGIVEAALATKPKKELAVLHEGLGTWEATVQHAMEGQKATEERGTEVVRAICGGRFTWSDFTGTMMGQPFEGHGICGYDDSQKKYVMYWIDSCSPTMSVSSGTYDEGKKAFSMKGAFVDPTGKPGTIEQTARHDGASRTLDMAFTCGDQKSTLKIAYKRKS
jgi:hypothetical protein